MNIYAGYLLIPMAILGAYLTFFFSSSPIKKRSNYVKYFSFHNCRDKPSCDDHHWHYCSITTLF